MHGKWLALAAALLGWMFDGLEQGLFPLVARPALRNLLGTVDEASVARWFAVATAGFLVGAATGGVLFGWLGDRLGRVRAMTLSVLTYAIFSGLCGVASSAWQIAVLRFISALGMGGEWALGVALVMEIWPHRTRALLAGLIGAAANVGFLLIAVTGLGLNSVLDQMHGLLSGLGLPESWVQSLIGNSGWRLLMLFGVAPAILTFFIQLFVPESGRWQEEQRQGATVHWAGRDLAGVGIGMLSALGLIYLWIADVDVLARAIGSLLLLFVATLGYMYPVLRYCQRAEAASKIYGRSTSDKASPLTTRTIVHRMLLGTCLSGVALLGTWASMQWLPNWTDQLTGGQWPAAKAYAQMCAASGAIFGTVGAALLGNWINRRATYSLLCLASLGAALGLFRLNDHYGAVFLLWTFLAGAVTASFYGFLPLYLPELFPTRVRTTCQGFSYNFGRVLAAIGVLQTGNLMSLFNGSYPRACSVMSLVYIVGIGIVWLAPETRGRPLPE
jgi:MFS family permease